MANLYHAAADVDRLERLAMGDSPVHRLHPMSKLVATMVYVVVVISFPSQNISGLMPFLFYTVVMTSLSGTPYRPLLERLLVALPFSLAGGISNLLFVRDAAFRIGGLTVSQGVVAFASIMLKTLLTVFAVLILIATTSFTEISYQLSVLRVPKILCLQLTMTYRYLLVLTGEAAAMFTAYALRAPKQKGIKAKDMGNFLGQLILRSFDRAERVYQSMKCRGFDGVYHGKERGGLRLWDWIFAVLLPVAMLMLRFFNLSVFLGGLAG